MLGLFPAGPYCLFNVNTELGDMVNHHLINRVWLMFYDVENYIAQIELYTCSTSTNNQNHNQLINGNVCHILQLHELEIKT